jgi:hypothetical protein
MYIKFYLKQLLEDLKVAAKMLLFNEYPEDNNCYLVFNCTLQEVIKELPADLYNKVISIEYPRDNFIYDKQ